MGHILAAVGRHNIGPKNHADSKVVCIHFLVVVLCDLHIAFLVRLVRVNPAAGFANNMLLVLHTQPQLLSIQLGELVDCT